MSRRHVSIGSLTWVVAALGSSLIGCDRVFQVLEVGDPGPPEAAPDGASEACLSDDFSGADVDDTKWTILDVPPVATAAQGGGELVMQN